MKCHFNYRIYPNKEQEELLQKTFGCCRFVYNYYLNKKIEKYKLDKSNIGYFACCADLTSLKKEKDYEWLKEAPADCLQSALKDLDNAFNNFFRSIKSNGGFGFPKFKSKYNNEKKFRVKQNIQLLEKHIIIPKIGKIKCVVSKKINGKIINCTVIQKPSKKYFVSICYEVLEYVIPNKTKNDVGIDLGIKNFATLSNGNEYKNPKYFKKSEKKLSKLQKQLSRKNIGSKRYEKARIKVAKAQEKIANQRSDFLHKISTQIINDYDLIAIEDLSVSGMKKNRNLSKSISDVGWRDFRNKLEYKADWYDKKVISVSKFYPSSQTCSNCGYINKKTKDLSVRTWICPKCGVTHDRDINAAKNILAEGIRINDKSVGKDIPEPNARGE